MVLLWLLHIEPAAMQDLLTKAAQENFILWAYGAPYEVKNELKAQGFSFNGFRRAWYRNFETEDLAQQALNELAALFDIFACRIELSNARMRFKLES